MEPQDTTTQDPIRIVIAQRGWVWIGRYHNQDGQVTLTQAMNIRRWGTDQGLGQLATSGKQPNTRLDPAGTVRLHELAVVATLDADEALWASVLV